MHIDNVEQILSVLWEIPIITPQAVNRMQEVGNVPCVLWEISIITPGANFVNIIQQNFEKRSWYVMGSPHHYCRHDLCKYDKKNNRKKTPQTMCKNIKTHFLICIYTDKMIYSLGTDTM